jgi:hypothetical protein
MAQFVEFLHQQINFLAEVKTLGTTMVSVVVAKVFFGGGSFVVVVGSGSGSTSTLWAESRCAAALLPNWAARSRSGG